VARDWNASRTQKKQKNDVADAIANTEQVILANFLYICLRKIDNE